MSIETFKYEWNLIKWLKTNGKQKKCEKNGNK